MSDRLPSRPNLALGSLGPALGQLRARSTMHVTEVIAALLAVCRAEEAFISREKALAAFRATYALSPTVPVVGPWRGRLLDRVGLRRVLVPGPVVMAACWSIAPFVGYLPMVGLVTVAGLFNLPAMLVLPVLNVSTGGPPSSATWSWAVARVASSTCAAPSCCAKSGPRKMVPIRIDAVRSVGKSIITTRAHPCLRLQM